MYHLTRVTTLVYEMHGNLLSFGVLSKVEWLQGFVVQDISSIDVDRRLGHSGTMRKVQVPVVGTYQGQQPTSRYGKDFAAQMLKYYNI